MGTYEAVRVRQDRPSDLIAAKAELTMLLKRLARGDITEGTLTLTRGRLRYVLGRWV